ncbi:MAG: DUF1622 domain-containing protein [Myxococcaceae bacterium]|nr:DUF1622 domain-containing protein [Myxococcaceae bacterium]
MGELRFQEWVALAARLMEAVGVVVMVAGAVVATGLLAFPSAGMIARGESRFHRFRVHLGRGILLGLEFLVAADIIRTVSELPTLERVVVLAVIVLIRTFLSVTLQVELEGRWPWQSLRGLGAGSRAHASAPPVLGRPGEPEAHPPAEH